MVWSFLFALLLSMVGSSIQQQRAVQFLEQYQSLLENSGFPLNDAYLQSVAKQRYSDPSTTENTTRVFSRVNPQKRNFWNQMICGPLGKGQDCEIDRDDLATQLPTLSATCTQNLLYLGANYKNLTLALFYLLSPSCQTNPTCLKASQAVYDKTEWTAKQLDSFGKTGPGVLNGNLYWWGSYQECRNLDFEMSVPSTDPWLAPANGHSRYQGKYCYAHLPAAYAYQEALASAALLQSLLGAGQEDQLRSKRNADSASTQEKQCKYAPFYIAQQGFCFPNGCSDEDIWKVIQRAQISLPGTNVTVQKFCGVTCQKRDLPMTPGAIVLSTILCLWAAVGIVATAVDYFYIKDIKADERGAGLKILAAFSLYTNGRKILDTRQVSGQIHCIHGIRFLSMTWVIMGHAYMDVLYSDNIQYVMSTFPDQIMNQTWINATVSVDTFFFLSGLLLGYLWFKRMWKTPKLVRSPFAWFTYYAHRYLRLTPIYAVVLAIYIVLPPWMTSGPRWLQDGEFDHKHCVDYWWTNMLYVSNLVNPNKDCYGVSWYLNNDMQFHWLAPILLLTFWLSGVAGSILTILLTGGCIAIRAFTVAHFHLQAVNTAFGAPVDPLTADRIQNSTWYGFRDLPPEDRSTGSFYNRFMYVAPWTRFAPYIIGIMVGYLMQRNKTLRIPRVVNVLTWIVGIASGLAIIYGLYENARGNALDLWVRALYAAVSRPLWGVLVAWVVVSCHYGYGGPINGFLSWRGFIPVSRLTYCAYMTHIFVSSLMTCNADEMIHFSSHFDWLAKRYVPMLFVSYVVSFFLSALVEHPVATLETMLFALCTPKPRNEPKVETVAPKTEIPEDPNSHRSQQPSDSEGRRNGNGTSSGVYYSGIYDEPPKQFPTDPNEPTFFNDPYLNGRRPGNDLWRTKAGMERYDKL